MGMDPKGISNRVFDAAVGRVYFRRWCDQSVDAIQRAVKEPAVTRPG
jgi:hypothetical protein